MSHKAIVDIHTLNNRFWEYDSFFCESSHNYYSVIQYLNSDIVFRNFLLFLEATVVFDSLIVDKTAYNKIVEKENKAIALPVVINELIEFQEFTDECYLRALEKTKNTINVLKNQDKQSRLNNLLKLQYTGALDPFFIGEDKAFMDQAGYGFNYNDHRWLTDSNNSLGRALFYIEVSSSINASLFLTQRKKDWLQLIGTALHKTIHDKIVTYVDDEIKKMALDFFEDLPLHLDIPVSPVIELIIKSALEKNCPLSSSVYEIRDTENVKEYRKFLSEITKCISMGRPGMLAVGKMLKSLKRAVSEWVTYLDLDLELTRRRRQLKIEKLPLIGDMLSFGGLSDIEVKDYILGQNPGYLAFIASWYGWTDQK